MAHNLIDTDARFVIDSVTHAIRSPSTKTVLIQKDHDSTVITFELARLIDGHDMSLCNMVEVHYINTDYKDKTRSNAGVYKSNDLKVADNANVVTCSWKISQNATQYVGPLSFIVSFQCVDDSGNVTYRWNTATYSKISVSAGIDNVETVVEEYPDILAQLQAEIDAAADIIVTVIPNEDETGYVVDGDFDLSVLVDAVAENKSVVCRLQDSAEMGSDTTVKLIPLDQVYIAEGLAEFCSVNTFGSLQYVQVFADGSAEVKYKGLATADNCVQLTVQTLPPEKQEQARKNIGAITLPHFNLIEMGLPVVPLDGSGVYAEIEDAAELLKAAAEGAVNITANAGSPEAYETYQLVVFPSINVAVSGSIQLCGTICLVYDEPMPFAVTLIVTSLGISAWATPLPDKGYVDAAYQKLLIVTLDEKGVANVTGNQIYRHIQNGGTAVFFTGYFYIGLTHCGDSLAYFATRNDDYVDYLYMIDDTGECQCIEFNTVSHEMLNRAINEAVGDIETALDSKTGYVTLAETILSEDVNEIIWTQGDNGEVLSDYKDFFIYWVGQFDADASGEVWVCRANNGGTYFCYTSVTKYSSRWSGYWWEIKEIGQLPDNRTLWKTSSPDGLLLNYTAASIGYGTQGLSDSRRNTKDCISCTAETIEKIRFGSLSAGAKMVAGSKAVLLGRKR